MPRKILHLDLDAFFCSVEEILDPSLVGKPFAVGGNPQGRGVIASCSYAARRLGIHSAMPTAQALKLCPELLLVHHRHDLYSQYSNLVMEILKNTSPLFEQVSIDEAFLDVSDVTTTLQNLAYDLQQRVQLETSLPCSIGGATNKMVAKVANDYGKSLIRSGKPPKAITIVEPGKEKEFLEPLNIQSLWGIGPKTAQKLRNRGVFTIGDLAKLGIRELEYYFGNNSQEISQRALGIDPMPVMTEHETKSVSNEITFNRDTQDQIFLYKTLRALSEKVAYRLRKGNLAGSSVHIKLRYSDFETITRQMSLSCPTNIDEEIYNSAKTLLKKNLNPDHSVRLLGVGVSKIDKPIFQLSLWDSSKEKQQNLKAAVDELKEKFGKDIIYRADQLSPKENDK